MLNNDSYFSIQWPAMPGIRTLISYKYNNLNFNLRDKANTNGIKNRETLENHLLKKVFWLNQLHSNIVTDLDKSIIKLNADASFTRQKNKVCVSLTADCVPLLLTSTLGLFVSGIHAGWKGLHSEIIANTIKKINLQTDQILCYIGPSICKEHYEVSNDILLNFKELSENYRLFFCEIKNNKFLCDLKSIAKFQLLSLGVLEQNIFVSNECTVCNNDKYFSYRKENNNGSYGVFASCIWME